ncbi:MAG: RNA polymerase sigma factor [Actinomycetota bacterium]|nr:RNA polymerase sigma factor [Actinomycetota bacterium]
MTVRTSHARSLTDGELIARSHTTADAFHNVFDRHFNVVRRYLARRVGRDRADDLASQTFTVAFSRRTTFRTDATDARPWLLGIATNLLMNERRAERRSLEAVDRMKVQPVPPAAELADDLLDHQVGAALAELDPDQRDVLLLFAWGELSYEEIALALAIPVGTVRSRMSRARSHLRRRLEPSVQSEEDPK